MNFWAKISLFDLGATNDDDNEDLTITLEDVPEPESKSAPEEDSGAEEPAPAPAPKSDAQILADRQALLEKQAAAKAVEKEIFADVQKAINSKVAKAEAAAAAAHVPAQAQKRKADGQLSQPPVKKLKTAAAAVAQKPKTAAASAVSAPATFATTAPTQKRKAEDQPSDQPPAKKLQTSAAPVAQNPKIQSVAEQAEDARLKLEEQRRLLQEQQDQIRRLEEVATRLDAQAAKEKAAKSSGNRSGRKATYKDGDTVFQGYSAAVNKAVNGVNGGADVLGRMQAVFEAGGRYMELRVPQTRTRKALMIQLPIKTAIDGQEVIIHLTITVPIFSQFFLNFLTGNFLFST